MASPVAPSRESWQETSAQALDPIPTPSLRGAYVVDLGTRRVTRVPEPGGWADVSAKGRVVGVTGQGFRIQNLDGSGRFSINPGGSTLVGSTRPDWSPNGARIAFDNSANGNPRGRIWIVRVADRSLRRVTTTVDRPYAPQWSPDGRELLYLAPWGAARPQIHVVDLASRQDRIIGVTDASSIGHAATWWPDGDSVLFECANVACTMRSDGSDIEALPAATHEWEEPRPSPDGGRIAYWADSADVPELWIHDVRSGMRLMLMLSAWQPVWIDDDRLLVRVAHCVGSSCSL
jgi:hypothetical protein